MEFECLRNEKIDSCKRDMESVGLKVEDVLDRTTWKNDIRNHSGDPDDGESPTRRTNSALMYSPLTIESSHCSLCLFVRVCP